MNENKLKEILTIQMKLVVPQIKELLQDLIPNKKITPKKEKELEELLDKIINYIIFLDKEFNKGRVFTKKEIRDGFFSTLGIHHEPKKLRKIIDSMALPYILSKIQLPHTDIKKYMIFYNHLIEESYNKKENKNVLRVLSNINIDEVMGFFQFLCQGLTKNLDFLFQKPFRFNSRTVTKLIETYEILAGYYEIFLKLIIIAETLITKTNSQEALEYNELLRLRVSELIIRAKKIPDFDIFLKPYDKNLRNKIIHKGFKIDYQKKVVIYTGKSISFQNLLLKTRNLLAIFISFMSLYTFHLRKNLEEAITNDKL